MYGGHKLVIWYPYHNNQTQVVLPPIDIIIILLFAYEGKEDNIAVNYFIFMVPTSNKGAMFPVDVELIV